MDIMHEIHSHSQTYNTAMKTGLLCGERAGLGKVADEINRLMDSGPGSADYRCALRDVRTFILAELRKLP